MDIDKDSIRDDFKWQNGCGQSTHLLSSYPDECGDTTTPWDIPVRNFMSYYVNVCGFEFTPCQAGAMHQFLDANTNYVVAESDWSIIPDIVISPQTTWSDTTVNLSSSQKIIVTKDGVLTLDKCTIT